MSEPIDEDLEDTPEPEDDEADPRPPAPVEPIRLVVEPAHEGARLDHFLRDRLPDRSRALLQRHIAEGAITVQGAPPKRGAKNVVRAGDVVVYAPPPPPTLDVQPEDIPLSILFEDEHLVVVDKPRNLVVHPALGHTSGTLVNALLHHFGRGAVTGDVRPGIVHRLDRDTTGAMVVAKNERVHERLSSAFRERRVQKRYLAVVVGVPKASSGTIDTLYGRHPTERKKFSSKVASGKRATTRYRVLEAFSGAASVEVDLLTGRTHQIRVHFADLGHPLVGDPTYGRKTSVRDPKSGEVIAELDRPALHAQRLAFEHPMTGAPIDITAPIPQDLTTLLARLAARSRPKR